MPVLQPSSGALRWLFTPKAIVVGQALLALPLVEALSRQVIADHWAEYRETLRSLGARPHRAIATLGYAESREGTERTGQGTEA